MFKLGKCVLPWLASDMLSVIQILFGASRMKMMIGSKVVVWSKAATERATKSNGQRQSENHFAHSFVQCLICVACGVKVT